MATCLLVSPAVRAADPYDKTLEARVEALERELSVMENDSKGKNVETTDVLTFARASANVQQLAYQQILGTFKVTNDITVSGAGGYPFLIRIGTSAA